MKAPFMTLKSAADELGKDVRIIRGVAIGMGINLIPIANGLCMDRPDYERLKARLAEHESKSGTFAPLEV